MGRRLAAILAADVVGYSRLIREDEAGTLAVLKAHRDGLIGPKVAERNGRIVKLMGDGLLAEFASAVEAVQCAVEIQHMLRERDADVSEHKRIAYRIGINIGDIVVEGNDIFGDGVNVAARLEGLAEPSGICVARNVFDQVKDKFDLTIELLGEREVKNIAEPVTVYRVVLDDKTAAIVTPVVRGRARLARQPWLITAAVVIPLLATGGAFWWRPWMPDVEPALVERMAFPLPDRPSIAVLPFTNMSDDPSQDYFADGMTEDLITDLSKLSGLFVIARNSSFSYKNRQVKVRQVAEELGVRYVLEGSVRRVGDQVRVNAQLIDATTAGHLWAERYDGSLDDVFGLQDQLTQQIVTALAVNLTPAEEKRQAEKETNSAEAYDAFLRGWTHYRRNTHDDFAKAREYFERALELDPGYSQALAALAATFWESFRRDWYTAMKMSRHETRLRAEDYLERALVNPTSLALQVSAKTLVWWGKHEQAVAEARKAVALNPNDSEGHITLAQMLTWSGNAEEALGSIAQARRLDPHNEAYHAYVEGLARFVLGQYQEATIALERALDLNPDFLMPGVALAVTYVYLDRLPEARAALKPYCEEVWCQNAATEAHWFPFRRDQDLGRFINGLVGAGLAE